MVLILYCTHFYISKGLKKFWILYRTGDHKRYIPIHYLAKQVISIAVILKAHILTGSDYASKIGNKSGALHCSREEYLLHSGDKNMAPNDVENIDKYLKVFKNTSKAETFNELRTLQYVEKSSSILKLAPTSIPIHGYLKRYT